MSDMRKWLNVLSESEYQGNIYSPDSLPDADYVKLDPTVADPKMLQELADLLLDALRNHIDTLSQVPLNELVETAVKLLGDENEIVQALLHELVPHQTKNNGE